MTQAVLSISRPSTPRAHYLEKPLLYYHVPIFVQRALSCSFHKRFAQ